jgi:hypothetical protein
MEELVMDTDELEQQLFGVDHDADSNARDACTHIDRADVLLKLVNLVGEPHIDSFKADAFVSLVCRLMVGEEASQFTGGSDAETFREYLKSVCGVLQKAIEPDARPGANRESILNVGMVDMLRTAAFCLAESVADREYTRFLRSGEGKHKGCLWEIIRGPRVSRDSHEAYSTAEAMYKNFRIGIDALENLSLLGEDELLVFMNTASGNLRACIECMGVPAIFDGQRLLAGNAIAAAMFGHEEAAYGSASVAKHALNANSSLMSLHRTHVTMCSFLAMSQIHASDCSSASTDADQMTREIESLIQDIVHMLDQPDKSGEASRVDSPRAIAITMSRFATWFDEAVHDDVRYMVIRNAFQSEVLVLGEGASDDLKYHWDALCKDVPKASGGIGMWTAVQIICSVRQSVANLALAIHTAMHVILSGIVGNSTLGHKINGPFVLNSRAKELAATYYIRFPKRFRNVKFDEKNFPVRDGTRKCKKTVIIQALLDRGSVRGQHEKGRLPETRLKAAITMSAWKESLSRDIPDRTSSSPSEGRKDLRRVYITALQTLPALNRASCYDEDKHSFLIEKSRNGDSGLTTADNVEKPWRDLLGGSLISTILFPLSGHAFMSTLINMEEPTHTNKCVLEFSERLESWSNSVFDPNEAVDTALPKDSVDYIDTIFAQQRSFIRSFCNTIKGAGVLWESFNLTFSVHASKDDEFVDNFTSVAPPTPPPSVQSAHQLDEVTEPSVP